MVKAKVNKKLLAKVDRLFTGKRNRRIIEILQNARRAGATRVEITNDNGWVTARDNGRGVEDFARLLDLGGSGWDKRFQPSEYPAGVGLFCLAPREVTIRSRGKAVRIGTDGWQGKPVAIEEDSSPVEGTELRFQDDPWRLATVELYAVFSGLRVVVDGKECKSLPFVKHSATAHPELGCRIEVCAREEISEWHRRWKERNGYGSVLVNFHGEVAAFNYGPISKMSISFLVDMTGDPTDVRLMLPDGTRLVENEAFEALERVLEVEMYRFCRRIGEHTLYYSEYLRARELGVDLPEAKPVYEVGLLEYENPLAPEPALVRKPKALPLANCYRLNRRLSCRREKFGINAHLLAALGSFKTPFVPVYISSKYDGYSWAKLPTIDKVEIRLGKKLQESLVWSSRLICVETITITAYTSDGRVFSSPVCMADLPCGSGKAASLKRDRVGVTPQAQKRLRTEKIWYHVGGYLNGDSYETQEADVQAELDRFWAGLMGPDEYWRQQFLEASDIARHDWRSVTISREGSLSVELADGSARTIQPPGEMPEVAVHA